MNFDLSKLTEEVSIEIDSSNIALPDSYSVSNAMKAAYLVLRETVDRNKRPVLEICSKESIYYAVLNMAIQGLNPVKDQCYFVPFGSKLVMMRGYMGSAMIAKRVEPRIKDIRAEVIYDGDKFQFAIINGRKTIKNHEQELTHMNKDRIIGAYAIAIGDDEKIIYTDIMPMSEIEQSWRQSSQNLFDEKGMLNERTTHYKFKAEMCKKTVIQRLCKPIINQSSDGALLRAALASDEIDGIEFSVKEEIAENANTKQIDFKSGEPAVKMANTGHLQVIHDLCKKLDIDKDDILKNISAFLGWQIEKSSDLTEKDAEEYIEFLENQIMESQSASPDWA